MSRVNKGLELNDLMVGELEMEEKGLGCSAVSVAAKGVTANGLLLGSLLGSAASFAAAKGGTACAAPLLLLEFVCVVQMCPLCAAEGADACGSQK
jgi:hypothetical protein